MILVNARVAVIGVLPAPPAEALVPSHPPATARTERVVYLGGWRAVPIFDLNALAPGQQLARPGHRGVG